MYRNIGLKIIFLHLAEDSKKNDDDLSLWEEVWTEVTPGLYTTCAFTLDIVGLLISTVYNKVLTALTIFHSFIYSFIHSFIHSFIN